MPDYCPDCRGDLDEVGRVWQRRRCRDCQRFRTQDLRQKLRADYKAGIRKPRRIPEPPIALPELMLDVPAALCAGLAMELGGAERAAADLGISITTVRRMQAYAARRGLDPARLNPNLRRACTELLIWLRSQDSLERRNQAVITEPPGESVWAQMHDRA